MAERRREIDRWLARRGLPNLASARDPWPRAARAVAAPLALWAVLCALVAVGDQLYGNEREVLVASAVIIGSVASWPVRTGLARTRSGRNRIDEVMVVAVIAGPTALAAALGDPWPVAAAGTFVAASAFVGLVFGAYAVGAAPASTWLVRRLAGQARRLVVAVARTWGGPALALVLGLVSIGPTWAIASGVSGLELAVFMTLGVAGWSSFALGQAATEMRRAGSFADSQEVSLWAGRWSAATPGDAVATPVRPATLDGWAKANALWVIVASALVPVLTVGLLAASFTMVVGAVAVEPTAAETWLGQPLQIVTTVRLGGAELAVSRELLVLALLVGSAHAAVLSVCAAVSRRWRSRLFGALTADLRTALAVRATQLADVAAPGVVDAGSPSPAVPVHT